MWESSAKVLDPVVKNTSIWKLKLKVMIGRKIGRHPARCQARVSSFDPRCSPGC